jgi:hypothetical protein
MLVERIQAVPQLCIYAVCGCVSAGLVASLEFSCQGGGVDTEGSGGIGS